METKQSYQKEQYREVKKLLAKLQKKADKLHAQIKDTWFGDMGAVRMDLENIDKFLANQ